jgi:YfiH family protein
MLQRRSSSTGCVYYLSPLLVQIGVPHAFSTRIGGVSAAPFDSLNLGNPSGCDRQDDDAHIQENYRRLQQAIGCESRTRCWVHQVHGSIVLDAARDGFSNGLKADALVSARTNQILAIRTADCVPVLISNAGGTLVAAIHAGWRGVIAGIIPSAIAKFESTALIAAIGPCIGFETFEVGTEVLAEFTRAFGTSAPIRSAGGGKGRVDLQAACRLQLLAAGVSAARIDLTDRCTFRDSHEFFSHRRDKGVTGRMAALISPRSG